MNEKFENISNVEKDSPICPYCKNRMCGMLSGSTICEPDMYRSVASKYSDSEIEILREDWGEGSAESARQHNSVSTE